MSLIDRLRVSWAGFAGAPGVNTLYFQTAALSRPAVNTFLNDAINADLPSIISVTTEAFGDTIESSNGEIRSTWVGSPNFGFTGANTGNYAAPTGAQVQWVTDSIIRGRHLVGKTFLVPLSNSAFQNDGTLDPAVHARIVAAANAFVAAHPGNFLVYSRPFAGSPTWTGPDGRVHAAKPAHDGFFAPVVQARVPDKAVVLRSRRD